MPLLPRIGRLGLVLLLAAALTACDTTEDPVVTIPGPPEVLRVDRDPAWSPDGRYVAYFRNAGRTLDTTDVSGLYVRDLDADSTWLVVEGFARLPDWRPDGERIAFTTGDIYTVRPDGADLQRVTDHGHAFFPSWAPDGKRIAYDATTLPQSGIWLIDPDGSNRKNLGLGRYPDWSALGERLVYEGPPGTSESGPQLWIADTSATDSTQITDNDFVVNRHPAWSPNGEWIAWVAADGPKDEPSCQLRVMRSDGSGARFVAQCKAAPIGWSPDSERIVFSRADPDSQTPDSSDAAGSKYTALWAVRRDGSDLRQLTDPSRNPLN